MFLERLGTEVTALRFGYFPVNNHTLGRFYLLPKIHKRLHNVPGRPDISSFLDFHWNLAKKKKFYIQDMYDFLKKISNHSP